MTARKDGQLLKRGDKMKGFKVFPIQIPDATHAKIKIAAYIANMTIYDFIMQAIQEKIEREGKK